MEYYKGSFEVGTSLHACGVATDLVITKCMEQQAGGYGQLYSTVQCNNRLGCVRMCPFLSSVNILVYKAFPPVVRRSSFRNYPVNCKYMEEWKSSL